MADILIRGMEMPKNCDECVHSGWSNFYQIYVCNVARKGNPLLFNGKQIKSTAIKRSGRAENCPLVELPPHGRLIDASEKVTVQIYDDMYEEFKTEEMTIDELLCAEWVEANAPTIIPAEGQ